MSEKKSTVGDPIWVESILSSSEYREIAMKYPETFSNGTKPVLFDPEYHKGGKWRNGMGAAIKQEEIDNINYNIDYLLKKHRDGQN